MKFLSLVYSIIDPTGLFAPLNFHVRRLLKVLWNKSGPNCKNQVELVESVEFLRWKKQLPNVAETFIGKITSIERVTKPNFMCLLTHLKTSFFPQ